MKHVMQGTMEYFVGESMAGPLTRLKSGDMLAGFAVDDLRLEYNFAFIREVSAEPGQMLEVDVTAGQDFYGQTITLRWDGEYYREENRDSRLEIVLMPMSDVFRDEKFDAFLWETDPEKRELLAVELRKMMSMAMGESQAGKMRTGH